MSSTVNEYDVGDLVRCTAAFTNSAGTAIDPAAVLFKVKDPNGTITPYTYGVGAQLVKDSTGNYHVDVSVGQKGEWWFRFYSTGSGQAADERKFTVAVSQF